MADLVPFEHQCPGKTSEAGLLWSEGEYRCDQLEKEGELSFDFGSLTRTPSDAEDRI